MKVLLVIALIFIGFILANILSKDRDENEEIEIEKKKKLQKKKDNSIKLQESLLSVKDLDPETELDFLVNYMFNSKLPEEDNQKVEMKLITFATNYSYYVVEHLLAIKKENKVDNYTIQISYFEKLILDIGFPSIFGLGQSYLEHIRENSVREYIKDIILQLKPINILKFIEFIDEYIEEKDMNLFLEDKKYLQEYAVSN